MHQPQFLLGSPSNVCSRQVERVGVSVDTVPNAAGPGDPSKFWRYGAVFCASSPEDPLGADEYGAFPLSKVVVTGMYMLGVEATADATAWESCPGLSPGANVLMPVP